MIPTSRTFVALALVALASGTAGPAGPPGPEPEPAAPAAGRAPKRFALIGPLDPYHRGHDDRAPLCRLIAAAGWTVDYDLAPPGAGKESGQLTGKIGWYVYEDWQPDDRECRDTREVADKALLEFRKKEFEAVQEARRLGIPPMRLWELVTVLADAGQVVPEDRPLAQSTPARLEVPVSMSFANDTPLEDVLKYIKSATQGPNDTGIPIYVDPLGLNEVEQTMTSPVTLDLEGVPLGITLRLLLQQLKLAYTIEDGLLVISSEARLADRIPARLLEQALRGELSPDALRQANEQVKALGELRKAVDEFRKASRERAR